MDRLWILLPLAILYGGLLGVALCTWTRHRHTPYLDRWMWLLVIITFSLLGPAVYLFLTREHGQQPDIKKLG